MNEMMGESMMDDMTTAAKPGARRSGGPQPGLRPPAAATDPARRPRRGHGRHLRALAAGSLALLLGACAAVPPRYVDNNDQLIERRLAVRIGSTPSFYADTPGRRMFGPFGAVSALRQGNRLIEELAIEDPAHGIARSLADTLREANRMAAADPAEADLILDVKTTNWDFRPYRNDPDQLFVVYAARVTLTERASGRVLLQDRCRSGRDPGDEASLDGLLAEQGRKLRAELAEAAGECLARLSTGPLRVALTPGVAPVAHHEQRPGFR